MVSLTLAVARGILLESALSFFGVGVQPPQASWGNMLYQAQATLSTEPWLALAPGLFILLTTLSVNLTGESRLPARWTRSAQMSESLSLLFNHGPRVARQQQLPMRPPRRDAVGHHPLVEFAQVERGCLAPAA